MHAFELRQDFEKIVGETAADDFFRKLISSKRTGSIDELLSEMETQVK